MRRLHALSVLIILSTQVAAVPTARAQWIADGVAVYVASENPLFCYPAIASDGSGGAIVTWWDSRNGDRDIFAQRIDSNGEITWASNGMAVCATNGDQSFSSIVSDGSGGAFIAWLDDQTGSLDIYAQRIEADGSLMWNANGAAVCLAPGEQALSAFIPDGSGGAIFPWTDQRSGNHDIYAQRFSANGDAMWTLNGVAVCTEAETQWNPEIVSDSLGGAVIAWVDYRSGMHIYAQSVGSDGSMRWVEGGIPISSASSSQDHVKLIPQRARGALAVMEDRRSGNDDIYAQRIGWNGLKMWDDDGVAVCAASGEQEYPGIVSDGAGGAIIVWQDSRSGAYDIYAQRVNANGLVLWQSDGVPVCLASEDQGNPQLVPDGSGGAIITWWDARNGVSYDIYAQRIASDGSMAWGIDGVAICTAAGSQSYPRLASDGSTGAIIAWQDDRNGNVYDIYAQRIDAAGHTVVATLLKNYAAVCSGNGITLSWTLSVADRDMEFFVGRATASNGPFIEIQTGALSRDGLSFSCIDSDWEPNASYWYRVEYSSGGERKMLFESGLVAAPAVTLTLFQNSPNPFNPSTGIRYYLPEDCHVVLNVYGIRGALISQLAEGHQSKGYHAASWDGRDRNGRRVNSGVYFYSLRAGKAKVSKKMVIAR